MEEFPSNSKTARQTEPREPIKPVTSAEAKQRKRGLGSQFKDTFFSGTGKDALGYVAEDIVVPAIRDIIYDALQGGLDRLIYGDSRTTRRRHSGPLGSSNAGHVNYAGMSTSSAPTTAQRSISRQARARHEFDELVIPSLQEANDVLDNMYEVLSRQGYVSVADLYALTDVRADHTDMKWGWTSLRGSRALPRGRRLGGYVLDLPKLEELA